MIYIYIYFNYLFLSLCPKIFLTIELELIVLWIPKVYLNLHIASHTSKRNTLHLKFLVSKHITLSKPKSVNWRNGVSIFWPLYWLLKGKTVSPLFSIIFITLVAVDTQFGFILHSNSFSSQILSSLISFLSWFLSSLISSFSFLLLYRSLYSIVVKSI